ncbi:GNAT family N-acetyltransferase [Haloarcula hispanica]|uniref:GNAT family N-acetyltransferase n=1 Tax=Haloarcula hispanica TaxID=51589 RepID=A0A5J5LIS4_HALHI|nr:MULTISPECIES: GNAT family N-acetyltransferase [Haloarcula]AJF26365.1 acetyltransferase [Haloarcula sp. CBA1115]KAA9409138.1 GNAT family N-acetyltransferase [Haloarcula hispanica]MUV51200.1 GNAT family N-acetyltransferase [Haloarcula sp. CBA1122]
MTVRPATPDDVTAINQVATAAWETDYPLLTQETVEDGVGDWYSPEQIESELVESQTLLFVAEREGRVVGFAHATWHETDRVGYILRLYVHPDYRREGIGRTLLERTCEELFEHDIDRINAMVLSANEPGAEFYKGFGFEFADESETEIGGERYPESRYVLADELRV